MKLLIGIPAYNEEKMIGYVIDSLPKAMYVFKKVDLVVVDDGSKDKTAEIAKRAKANVLRHILNRGLGGSIKTIFAYCRKKGYDVLVTFDADGQHDAANLSKIVDPILKKKSDVVIGSRWKYNRKIALSRFIINQLANIITFIFFGIWSSDSQSGLRAFNKKAISAIELHTDGMEVSSEIFKEIYKKKLIFKEVPINPIYTEYSRLKGQKLSNAPNVFRELLLRLMR